MIKIEAYQGDITQLELDALVSAANNRLWMGGGVAGALKRVGGKEIACLEVMSLISRALLSLLWALVLVVFLWMSVPG